MTAMRGLAGMCQVTRFLSWRTIPTGMRAQGVSDEAQISQSGFTTKGSSSAPALANTHSGRRGEDVKSGEPQSAQKWRLTVAPLSPCVVNAFGEPATMWN